MFCYIHEQKEAVGACVHCGKFICEECRIEIKGKNYCKKCVSEVFEGTDKNSSSQSPMVLMNAGGGGLSNSNVGTNGLDNTQFVCTKSRTTAILLAFFLGGIGVHKFYLGKIGLGVVYLLFSWTLIPSVIAFIEFIILLCTSEAEFDRKYGEPVMN